MKKRLIALLLCCVMVLGLLPTVAFAREPEEPAGKGGLGAVLPEEPVLTVKFYASASATAPFAQQMLKNGEQLEYPDVTGVCPSGSRLDGYETTGGTDYTDFETALAVTESQELRLNARFVPVDHYIFYHDTDGNVIRTDPYVSGYTFHANAPAFFAGADYANTAWNTSAAGTGTNYADGAVLSSLSADLDVYPVLQQGHKVRFDSDGGTPISYQFVLPGGTAEEPDDPARDGYTFAGWFNGDTEYDFSTVVTAETTLTAHWTAAQTTYSVRIWLQQTDGSYKYNFSFTKPGTTGGNAEFTTADQNRADVKALIYTTVGSTSVQTYFCDNQYDETALDMTNASIAAVNNNGGLAADGSSVINVYFRRLVLSCTLEDGNLGLFDGGPYSYTFPSRMGESLGAALTRNNITVNSDFLATLQEGFVGLPYQAMFWFNGITKGNSITQGAVYYGNTQTSLSSAYSMAGVILNDGMSTAIKIVGRAQPQYIFERRRYSETLESALEGRETNFRNFSYDNFTYTTSLYDWHSSTNGYIDGSSTGYSIYFLQLIDDDGNVMIAPRAYDGSYLTVSCQPYHADLFQVRNHYTVDIDTLTTYVSADSQTLIYGEPLSDLNGQITYTDTDGTHEFVVDETEYTDSTLKTWVFKGWYDNDAFVGSPVDFATTTGTMPANPVHYYAKWEPKQIEITYDGDGGTLWTGESTYVTMENNGIIPTRPADPTPPEGMLFYCWMRNGVPYDFTEPLFTDDLIQAYYYSPNTTYTVTYNKGAGSGTAPTDGNSYLYQAGAAVLSGDSLTAPTNQYFVYWQGSDGNNYFPGDQLIVKGNTTLTAVYGEHRYTSLTYHPGTGSGTALTDLEGSVTGVLETPTYNALSITGIPLNAHVTLSSGAGFSKEGYTLVGWNANQSAAAAGTVQYATGASCLLDDPAGNTLYAVYEIDTYELTTEADTNSTILNGFTYDYDPSATIDVTFSANTGYRISSVSVDGTALPEAALAAAIAAGKVVVDKKSDHSVVVTTERNEFDLVIHYVYAGGGTAAADHTETLTYQSSYSVDSPAITGYTPDQATVSGTITDDVELTVTYTAKSDVSYTVHYYKQGSEDKVAEDKVVENKTFGQTYQETAETVTGYTVVAPATQSVTLDAYNKEITFYYTANTDVGYTVHYYMQGTTDKLADDKVVENKTFGQTYQETAVSVTGYTVVAPATQSVTLDAYGKEIIFYYTTNAHTVTYKVTGDYFADAEYHVDTDVAYGTTLTEIADDMSKTGYTWSGWTGLPATMPDEDVVVTGSYTANTDVGYTVHYYKQGTTDKVKDDKTVTGKTFGQTYSEDAASITGYTAVAPTTQSVTLDAYGKEIIFYYTTNAHTVTYKITGDFFANESYHVDTDVAYGTTLTEIADDMTKTGYTWSGWTGLPATMPDEDVVVTGSYTVNRHNLTIHYVYSDGSMAEADYSADYDYDAPYEVVSPSQSGYTAEPAVVSGQMPDQNVEITVTYYKERHKVFYYDDRDFTILLGEQTYEYGDSITAMKDPGRAGYYFFGWYQADGSDLPAKMPDHDVYVYAARDKIELNFPLWITKNIITENEVPDASFTFEALLGDKLIGSVTVDTEGRTYIPNEEIRLDLSDEDFDVWMDGTPIRVREYTYAADRGWTMDKTVYEVYYGQLRQTEDYNDLYALEMVFNTPDHLYAPEAMLYHASAMIQGFAFDPEMLDLMSPEEKEELWQMIAEVMFGETQHTAPGFEELFARGMYQVAATTVSDGFDKTLQMTYLYTTNIVTEEEGDEDTPLLAAAQDPAVPDEFWGWNEFTFTNEYRYEFPFEVLIPTLNREEHYAYMNGYTDGTFKPNNNITKAEVATIFYHLLDEESRYFYWTEENAFSDVSANDWFNTAVSTMVNAGLMDGEADGKFHPNQLATRADIAKIIYNFADQNMVFDSFKDVEGHWAKIYILTAAGNGWISGYPDGTFRPDGNVTRAEAVAIINRVLDRVPADQTRLFSNMIRYSDVTPDDWFYLPIQEATTSHTYERTSYLKNFADENWLERIPNINWTLVEMDMRLRMLQF